MSTFGLSLHRERMEDYLTVSHDEGVSSHFVHIVRRFRVPENVCIVTIDGA